MTTSFTPYAQINSLDEFSIVAGSTFVITFQVYQEEACVNLLDLTGSIIKWVLSPYGDTSSRVLIKTGVITGLGTFTITLAPSDTSSLSGKYIHQPVVTDFSGSVFRPAQGTMLILPQIPTT